MATIVAGEPDTELVALDAALGKLAQEDPESARVVEMRFFAGLTHAEIGQILGLSERSARRHWEYARAWLHRELDDTDGE